MRILSLDVGKKKIGIAISGPLGITSQGLDTLFRKNKKNDLERLKKIIRDMDVSKLVVGLPLNMDGTTGAAAEGVYDFVEKLKKEIELPVEFWDERLTTMEANRILLKADLSRKKRKSLDDKIAAQLILQSYLDSHGKDT